LFLFELVLCASVLCSSTTVLHQLCAWKGQNSGMMHEDSEAKLVGKETGDQRRGRRMV
jgi:hypothetical protein